jgi:hypothetical protein
MSPDYARIISEFTESPAPGAVLRCVADIPKQELQWLWPGRIPLGKLSLFAGDPGLGKSLVTLDIAARVTCGRDWPDGTANSQPGSVIILSAEDDPGDTIRPRLESAGADLTKVHILQAIRRAKTNGDTSFEQFSLETDLEALQDAAASLDDARLVVLDPISAYLGSTDSHVNAKMRGLLAPLSDMASGLRVAVGAVTHLNKSLGSAIYRSTGSIAFVAAARAVWLFAKSPDDPSERLMLPGKINLAADQEGMSYSVGEDGQGVPVVAWGKAVNLPADSVLSPEPVEYRSERLEAMEWLRECLSAGPVPSKRIQSDAKAAGISSATLRRAKESLCVTSGKGAFEGGWEWCLKGGQDEDAHPSHCKVNTFEQPIENKPDGSSRKYEDVQGS